MYIKIGFNKLKLQLFDKDPVPYSLTTSYNSIHIQKLIIFLSLHNILVNGMPHGNQSFGIMFMYNNTSIRFLHQKNNKSSNSYPEVSRLNI